MEQSKLVLKPNKKEITTKNTVKRKGSLTPAKELTKKQKTLDACTVNEPAIVESTVEATVVAKDDTIISKIHKDNLVETLKETQTLIPSTKEEASSIESNTTKSSVKEVNHFQYNRHRRCRSSSRRVNHL